MLGGFKVAQRIMWAGVSPIALLMSIHEVSKILETPFQSDAVQFNTTDKYSLDNKHALEVIL